MKPYKGVGGGGFVGILKRGLIVARYNAWALLICFVVNQVGLLGVSYCCIYLKKNIPCPCDYLFLIPTYWIPYPVTYL